MTTIETVEGDTLDELIALHYGADALSDALAAVLAANAGLAGLGNDTPAGTRIKLPDLGAVARRRPALW